MMPDSPLVEALRALAPGWRVVCDCGYVVEGLQRADASRFAQQHADDEHAPTIDKPHDDLPLDPGRSGNAFEVIDRWMACRGDIGNIGDIGDRYCLTARDIEHLGEHVDRWVAQARDDLAARLADAQARLDAVQALADDMDAIDAPLRRDGDPPLTLITDLYRALDGGDDDAR